MWKRNDKFFLSETGEVWEDGIVYWDACSTQTCRFEKVEDDATVKAKYVKLFVQLVPVGPDGLPTDYGTTVGSGHLNLSQFVDASLFVDNQEKEEAVAKNDNGGHSEEEKESRHEVQVALHPGGHLNLRLYVLNTVTGSDDVDETSDVVTPKAEYVDGHVNGTPLLKADRRTEEAVSHPSPVTLSSTFSSSFMTQSEGDDWSVSKAKSPCIDNDTDVAYLQRKLKKVTKQCEEARARAFSEASVSLQRGIEIDNLKRAKDILLRRLETTDQQLMTMMKQELAMTIRDNVEGSMNGMDSVIHTLAETKVALAEKEFESMELQGKLRAREAHIEALTLHLDAIRSKAELDSAQNSFDISSMLGTLTLEKSTDSQTHCDKDKTGNVVHVRCVAN